MEKLLTFDEACAVLGNNVSTLTMLLGVHEGENNYDVPQRDQWTTILSNMLAALDALKIDKARAENTMFKHKVAVQFTKKITKMVKAKTKPEDLEFRMQACSLAKAKLREDVRTYSLAELNLPVVKANGLFNIIKDADVLEC